MSFLSLSSQTPAPLPIIPQCTKEPNPLQNSHPPNFSHDKLIITTPPLYSQNTKQTLTLNILTVYFSTKSSSKHTQNEPLHPNTHPTPPPDPHPRNAQPRQPQEIPRGRKVPPPGYVGLLMAQGASMAVSDGKCPGYNVSGGEEGLYIGRSVC